MVVPPHRFDSDTLIIIGEGPDDAGKKKEAA
jgi:hypothetical protein